MMQTVFERQVPQKVVIQAALAGSVNRPFWIDDVAARPAYSTFQGTESADLVIVGAGYLGLWSAILAKERDPERSVMLLEGRRVGWAASSRNGGFCEASITHGAENGLKRWPEEYAQLEALGMQNLAEIEATIKRYGIDCDFERSGVLVVAVEPYQDEQLRGAGYLSLEQVRAEVASPTFLSGQWERDSTAMLHPGKLVVELARVAVELGVRIFEQSAVTGLKSRARGGEGPMQVRTAMGEVMAKRVILATNVFPSVLKRYRWHTVPVYDYVLMTEPLTPEQLASVGWRHRQGIADMGNQFHYYRITRDQRICLAAMTRSIASVARSPIGMMTDRHPSSGWLATF